MSLASRLSAAICIVVLAACSPARPPAPEEAKVERPAAPEPADAVAHAEAAAHARAEAPGDAPPDSALSSPAETAPAQAGMDQLQPGDIIFHVSRSAQSKAIQLATKSPYSHVGVVESGSDGLVILEAVQPVKRTPVGEWIARGRRPAASHRRDKVHRQALRHGIRLVG